MKKERYFGDMVASWLVDEDGGVHWQLVPTGMQARLVPARKTLAETEDLPYVGKFLGAGLRQGQPPVDVARSGDVSEGNSGGATLRGSSTSGALRWSDQTCCEADGVTHIKTVLQTEDGLVVIQHIEHQAEWQAMRTWTEVRNTSLETQVLDYVASTVLGGLSPFARDDAPGRLVLHRYQAGWSSEGRHLPQPLEEIELERSWAPYNLKIERFGQLGSKPTQRWMPWLGLEDTGAGVVWAMHHEAVGSWQAEVARRDDGVALSIGPGDRQFAQRQVVLASGQSYATEATWLTVCQGDVQDAAARLVASLSPLKPAPVEADLPIVFNEWCTTWGDPSHEKLLVIADRLQGTPCKYLVIDAGWYRPEVGNWAQAQGDWIPNAEMFPQGLAATCEAIRKRGLIPGLWFEFEVVGTTSAIFNQVDRMLTRDGLPIQAGARRFLDLRQLRNRQYIEERMLDLIDRCGIGYLKVDYNANTGEGVDGPLSPGANLAEHLAGVVTIFQRLRERFPHLVIENCASGGQRLTPAFGRLADMHSFSDAHTCGDIPVIAGNVQAVIPVKQNQIWAVLMPEESPRRISYSLAATFLGRMCLSGEIWGLEDDASELVEQSMALYREVWPILKDGTSRRYGAWSASMRKLRGWQGVVREGACGEVLVVLHAFGEGASPDPLPVPGRLSVKTVFGAAAPEFVCEHGCLTVGPLPPWSACVVWLTPVTSP